MAMQTKMPRTNPDVVRKVFRLAPEPIEIIEMVDYHSGLLYYPSELFVWASAVQRDFLTRYLKENGV